MAKEQLSTEERLDRQLARSGMEKIQAGEQPNSAERAAIKRLEKKREEELRWQYYRSIPKKHWQAMSGRQVKVINEQALRYGLPLDGPEIDLTKLARAIHDFLAANSHRFGDPEDPMMGGNSPALERFRAANADIAEMKRDELRRQLANIGTLGEGLLQLAGVLRRAGETLVRKYGNDAGVILNEAIDEAEAGWLKMLSDAAESNTDAAPETGGADPAPAAPHHA